MTNNDLFSEENKPESNWAKFEKVGDAYSGTLVGVSDKEGVGNYPAQRVYELRQEDGSIVNVGISEHKSYVTSRANQAQMGDELGFQFAKEVPSQTKGNAPAKSIEVFIRKGATPAVEDTFDFQKED